MSEHKEDDFAETLVPPTPSRPEAHLLVPMGSGLSLEEKTLQTDLFGYLVTPETMGRYDRASAKVVGQGGIGRVLSVYDRHLHRQVAIKELLAPTSLQSSEEVSSVGRFVREARVLALLDHPSIAPVYELGQRADGSLYYVMRLVHGRTLEKAIDEAATLEDRLQLLGHFVDLCNAIAYAHTLGVIHRDIKPMNVMVGRFNDTIVLDWGTAKLRDDVQFQYGRLGTVELEASELGMTDPGSLMGTPYFMSPEQAEARFDQVDEASDVWSLGMVLRQIVTGVKAPYTAKLLPALLLQVKDAKVVPLGDHCPEAPGELVSIIQKCLEKERSKRYPSAKALADDVEAFRCGGRVSVYKYTQRERIKKFVARHRVATSVAMIASAILAVVVTGAWIRLVEQRNRAVAAEIDGRRNHARGLLNEAQVLAQQGRAMEAEATATASLLELDTKETRGFLVQSSADWRPRLAWRATGLALSGARFIDADTRRMALIGERRIEVFDLEKGGKLAELALPEGVKLGVLDFTGSRLVMGDGRGSILMWTVGATDMVEVVRNKTPALAVALDPKGELLATGDASSNCVFKLEPSGAERIACSPQTSAARAIVFGPDSQVVAWGDASGWVQTWDRKQGAFASGFSMGRGVRRLSFSQSGDLIAAGGSDGLTEVRRVADGALRAQYAEDAVELGFAAQDVLVSLEGNGMAHRHVLGGGASKGTFPAALTEVVSAAMSRAGDGLIVLDAQGHAYEWSLQPPRSPTGSVRLGAEGKAVACAPESGIAAISAGNILLMNHVVTGQNVDLVSDFSGLITALRWASSGVVLAIGLDDGTVRSWSPITKALDLVGSSTSAITSLVFSSGGEHLAASNAKGELWVKALNVSVPMRPIGLPGLFISALAFETDGSRLYAGTKTGLLLALDVGAPGRSPEILARGAPVSAIASGGKAWAVAAARTDGTLTVIDQKFERPPRTRVVFDAPATSIDISVDGRFIALGSQRGTLAVLEVESLREVAVWKAHADDVRAIAFAPEGDVILSTGRDGAARWDIRTLSTAPRVLADRIARRQGLEVVPNPDLENESAP